MAVYLAVKFYSGPRGRGGSWSVFLFVFLSPRRGVTRRDESRCHISPANCRHVLPEIRHRLPSLFRPFFTPDTPPFVSFRLPFPTYSSPSSPPLPLAIFISPLPVHLSFSLYLRVSVHPHSYSLSAYVCLRFFVCVCVCVHAFPSRSLVLVGVV